MTTLVLLTLAYFRISKPSSEGFFVLYSLSVGVYFSIMIHYSKIHELVDVVPVFSIGWVAESGEKIYVRKATCTSFHSSGETLNIKIIDSGLIRKVNRITITEFNGEEVFV